MTPELGFIILIGLLCGPTVLWLLYRAALPPRSRVPGSLEHGIAAEAPALTTTASLSQDGYWACGSCRSVNRPETKRCYSCRATRGAATVADPEAAAGAPGMPVMAATPSIVPGAAAIAGLPSSLAAAGSSPAPVAIPVVPAPPIAIPIVPDSGVPTHAVAAAEIAAASVAPVTTASPRATPVAAGPQAAAHATPAAADAQSPAAADDAPEVCPFLGLREDPSTRLDFPDPKNACHAATGGRRPGSSRVRGAKAQAIEPDHQAARCLTATHRGCARYPVPEAVAIGR